MFSLYSCISCQKAILDIVHYSFCPPDCSTKGSQFCHHYCTKCIQTTDCCDSNLVVDNIFTNLKEQIDIRREQLFAEIEAYSQRLIDNLAKERLNYKNTATKICTKGLRLTAVGKLNIGAAFGTLDFEAPICKPVTIFKARHGPKYRENMQCDDRGLLYIPMACVISVFDPTSPHSPLAVLRAHEHEPYIRKTPLSKYYDCGESVGSFCAHETVNDIAIRGNLLASSGINKVDLWCTIKHTHLRAFRVTEKLMPTVLSFSEDGLLAAACCNGIWIWDISKPTYPSKIIPLTKRASQICFCQNGIIASAGEDNYNTDEEATISVWNTATGECIHKLDRHRRHVTSMCYVGNGQLVSAGEFLPANFPQFTSLCVWDLTTGQFIKAYRARRDISRIVYDAKHNVLISLGVGLVQWWDISTGQAIRSFAPQLDMQKDVFGLDIPTPGRLSVDERLKTHYVPPDSPFAYVREFVIDHQNGILLTIIDKSKGDDYLYELSMFKLPDALELPIDNSDCFYYAPSSPHDTVENSYKAVGNTDTEEADFSEHSQAKRTKNDAEQEPMTL